MISALKRNYHIAMVAGIVAGLLASLIITGETNSTTLIAGIALCVVSIGLWYSGCWNFAVEKGYSGVIGLLLGLFSLIGALILVILPNRATE